VVWAEPQGRYRQGLPALSIEAPEVESRPLGGAGRSNDGSDAVSHPAERAQRLGWRSGLVGMGLVVAAAVAVSLVCLLVAAGISFVVA